MDIGVSVQRAEDIEKRMDELEQELNSLDNCEDRKYAKKRTKEILKESRKLTMELMKAVSKFAKKNKLIDIFFIYSATQTIFYFYQLYLIIIHHFQMHFLNLLDILI